MKIQTKITNQGRTPFQFNGPKGARITVKGGQVINLPYDIYSILNKIDIRELEKGIKKGILKVETDVFTDQSVLKVTPSGVISIDLAKAEAAAEPETVKVPHNAIPEGFNNKPAAKPNLGATGTVVTRGSAALKSIGASTRSDLDGKIVDLVIKNGKAENMGGQGSVIGAPQIDRQMAVDSHNVFNKEEAENEASAMQQVTTWLQNKEYSAVFEWLTKNYPDEFANTTKAAVRKCKTFEDLRTLLDI